MRLHHTLCRLCTCAALALCWGPLADARMVVMHGFADYTSATLWVQTDGPGTVTIDLARAGKEDEHVPLRWDQLAQ